MAKKSKKNKLVAGPLLRKKLLKIVGFIEKENIPLSRLILFGSHAKGTATRYSDIDLCLLFPRQNKYISQYTNRISMLVALEGIAADFLGFSEREYRTNKLSPILHQIRKTGVHVRHSSLPHFK